MFKFQIIRRALFGLVGLLWMAGPDNAIAQQSALPQDSPPEMVLQVSHRLMVADSALASDKATLATGSWDGTIKLWNIATGEVERTLMGSYGAVNKVAFSPDGKTLFSGSGIPATHDDPDGPGEACLWDLKTGTPRFKLPPFPHPVSQVAISKNGQTLVTVCYREVPATAQQPAPSYRQRAFNTQIQLWSVGRGGLLKTLELPNTLVVSLKVSPDGRLLALGTSQAILPKDAKKLPSMGRLKTQVRFYDPSSLRLLRTLSTPGMALTCLAWSPDGRILATGHGLEGSGADDDRSSYGPVRLWDVKSGKVTAILQSNQENYWGDVGALAWSPDGKTLAVSKDSMSSSIVLWDAARKVQVRRLPGFGTEQVASMVYTGKTGKPLLIASGGHLDHGALQFWDTSSGHLDRHLTANQFRITGIKLSPDQSTLVTDFSQISLEGKSINGLKVWDLKSGQFQKSVGAGTADIDYFGYSPDGRWVATNGADILASKGALQIFDTRTWKRIINETGQGSGPVAFAPDSKTLAVSDYSSPHLLDFTVAGIAPRLKERQVLDPDFNAGDAVSFSPDGRALVAVGGRSDINYGEMRLWDLPSGKPSWTVTRDKDYAGCVSFAPDGKQIATGHNNGSLHLWNAQNGGEEKTLKGHAGPVTALAWGSSLWSAGLDGTVRCWSPTSGQEIAKVSLKSPVLDVALAKDGERLITLSGDNKIQLWNLGNQGQPDLRQSPNVVLVATIQILEVSVDAMGSTTTQWMVTTPDGYYASSSGASAWVRWRRNGQLLPASAIVRLDTTILRQRLESRAVAR